MRKIIFGLGIFLIFGGSDCCNNIEKADLLIDDIISTTHNSNSEGEVIINVGEKITFVTDVLNMEAGGDCSTEDAISSGLQVLVKIFDGNTNIGSADSVYTTPSISAGTKEEVTTTLSFNNAGEYELTHEANFDRKVKERNYDNNLGLVFEILDWVLELILNENETQNYKGKEKKYRIRVVEPSEKKSNSREKNDMGKYVNFY